MAVAGGDIRAGSNGPQNVGPCLLHGLLQRLAQCQLRGNR